jgi:hypothetical protein
MTNVQVMVSMSKPFYGILQKIAADLDETVEFYMLKAAVSFVESVQNASEDPVMQGGGLGKIDCDNKLLALAMGSKKKKKPFLTDEEVSDLMDRFRACWERLLTPVDPFRQAEGAGRIIDMAGRRRRN